MSVKLNKSINKIVEAYFGKDAVLRDQVATITSNKNLKKAVKSATTEYVNSTIDTYSDYLEAHLINIATTRAQCVEGLTTEEMEVPLIEPSPIDHKKASQADLEGHSHAWAVYRLKESLILLEIKEEVIHSLQKGGKKLLSKLVQLFLSKYSVYKRDNVLINTVVNSTGHALDTTTDEIAFSVISLIGGTGLFKRELITGRDGGQDTVLVFDDAKYSHLKTIANRVDGMFPELFVTKIDRSIVKRRKAAYEQAHEPLADVVDYLQSIGLSLVDGDVEDMALEATKVMIKDEDGDSIIDAKWKVRLSEINLEAYKAVHIFGTMYDKFGSDGVARLYSEGRISIQHKATHNDLQFTNKKALNTIGRKYTKLLIVDKAGYKVDGVKPTEEQALAYFESNENQLAKEHSELYAMLKSRKHTGFIMEVDAQTQGPSIYGMTGLHFNLLNGTGLIGSTYRTDFYLALARYMNKDISRQLGRTIEIYDRNNVKSALMTAGYGAGYITIMFGDGKLDRDTGDFTVKAKSIKQVPLMQVAGNHDITDTKVVWTAFQRAMKTLVPEVMEMQARLELLAESHKSHITKCVMPDDVEVSIIDQKMVKRVVKWIGSDMKVHQATHARMLPDPDNAKSLAPRFIQAIDAYILRLVVRYMKEKGLQIQVNHDGYFVHPNDVEEVQEAYLQAVLDVMKRDLLTDMVRQVFGEKVPSFQAKRIRMGNEIISEEYLTMLVSSSKYSLWV